MNSEPTPGAAPPREPRLAALPTPAVPAEACYAMWTAERACCCPARPAVIALLPPGPGRDHSTDLLLCGHHYRRARHALDAAGAAILDETGRAVLPQAIALLGAG